MMTAEQAAITKGLLARGEKQHDVAAFFGVNGGRIAEIAKGKKFAEVPQAAKKDLPSPAALMNGYGAFVALQALQIIDIAVRSARERLLNLVPEQTGRMQ
jgi:hypothetical protein